MHMISPSVGRDRVMSLVLLVQAEGFKLLRLNNHAAMLTTRQARCPTQNCTYAEKGLWSLPPHICRALKRDIPIGSKILCS